MSLETAPATAGPGGSRSGSDALDVELSRLERPVLVLSTRVGRGMFSLGEAVVERLGGAGGVHHRAIEDFLPSAGLREDVERYRSISSHLPVLLHIPYRVPLVYWRKLARERRRPSDLSALADEIARIGARSAVCISHRPAFWLSAVKRQRRLDLRVAGLLGEYGSSLGWRFVFWPQIDLYLSPVPRSAIRFTLPEHVRFVDIELPARRAFEALAARPGDPYRVLLSCGIWGQGSIERVARRLLEVDPALVVEAVCGENEEQRRRVARLDPARVRAHGAVDSLLPVLATCGSVVTKPGISTLLEARAARRPIFLLHGMPVAEDNNARHALEHFHADWFDPVRFRRWLDATTGAGTTRERHVPGGS